MDWNLPDSRIENREKACMFEYGETVICVDPALPLLRILGKKYTIMIIGILGNRVAKKNFNEILRDIPFSSATIISRRLKELISLGIVEKFTGEDRILLYRLTDLGSRVRESLQPLLMNLQSIK
ncbi:MAG: helix-turn-helix transcriptional regulator [Candidatus Thermoplasmatota archaeon]|nr:helix-turn-helix transcriptional regulator [Candidatus Thermoplasmatota archaeon]